MRVSGRLSQSGQGRPNVGREPQIAAASADGTGNDLFPDRREVKASISLATAGPGGSERYRSCREAWIHRSQQLLPRLSEMDRTIPHAVAK